MSSPDVLVVMPVYNAEAYVAEAIQSILNQTYPSFSLFIVNDGSSDASANIIDKYRSKNVIIISQHNQGPGSAMNLAMHYAQEHSIPYIARADADDLSTPDRLEKQIRLLEENPKAAVCSANCYYFDSKTGAIIGSSTVSTSTKLIRWEITAGMRGLIQGVSVFRTNALLDVGGYRLEFKGAEETDVFLRLSEKYEFCNSGDFLAKIRFHSDSYSIGNSYRNTLYHFYALDCFRRQKQRISEISFDQFRDELTALTRFNIWHEETFLRLWRKYLIDHNVLFLVGASLFDPRRVFFRMLRKFMK